MRIHTVQLNLGDLMGGTSRMDATEFGAYALLFLNCYQDSTHALPSAEDEIRAIARVTPTVWKRIREKVMKKFYQDEEGWRHRRVDEEIKKIIGKSSKNSANALKRWETGNANALPDDKSVASDSQSERNATQEPVSKNNKTGKYNYDDPDFEKFWAGWTQERRQEKPKAYSEWRIARRKCPPERLIEYAQAYLQTREAKEGYAPRPARWLKNERWLEVMEIKELAKADITLADIGGDTPQNKEFLVILMTLKKLLGEAVFRSWIARMRVAEKTETELTLAVDTRFVAEWIKKHFDEHIRAAVKETWPGIQAMKFKIQQRSVDNAFIPRH